MKILQVRTSDVQQIQGQFPCMATNIGDNRICVHVNIDDLYKKALVFEFDKLSEDDESFDGFVAYSHFKDVGIYLSNIKIDTSSRFVFLTRSREMENGVWRFWLNLLVVSPFSINPQACFFRSSKVFKMDKNPKFEDIINKCTVFMKDNGDIWLFKQYTNGFHQSKLKTDDKDKNDKEKEKVEELKRAGTLGVIKDFHDKAKKNV